MNINLFCYRIGKINKNALFMIEIIKMSILSSKLKRLDLYNKSRVGMQKWRGTS